MSCVFHTKCTAALAAKTCNELFIWWIILPSPLLEYPIACFHFCFGKIYYSGFFSLDSFLNISCSFSPSCIRCILFPGSSYPSALVGPPSVGKLWEVQFLPVHCPPWEPIRDVPNFGYLFAHWNQSSFSPQGSDPQLQAEVVTACRWIIWLPGSPWEGGRRGWVPREKSCRGLLLFCPFSFSVLPQRHKELHFTVEDFLPWVLYVTMPGTYSCKWLWIISSSRGEHFHANFLGAGIAAGTIPATI